MVRAPNVAVARVQVVIDAEKRIFSVGIIRDKPTAKRVVLTSVHIVATPCVAWAFMGEPTPL
jgi:hypothetical protein